MTDPSRLLEGEANAFERSLLDAAANERPPAELLATMQQALGASTIAAKAGAGATASSSLAYVALAALAAGGAVIALVALREPAPEFASPPRESPARVMEAPAPAPVEPREPEAPRELVNEVAPVPREQLVGPAPTPRKAARASSVSELRDEIRLMDQARAALRAGSADKALALLARYAQRYPEGAFRQEATVLQLEALERAGQRSKASSLARKFLDEHPESPHVERVGRAIGDK